MSREEEGETEDSGVLEAEGELMSQEERGQWCQISHWLPLFQDHKPHSFPLLN